MIVCKALSLLMSYPDEQLIEGLPQLQEVLQDAGLFDNKMAQLFGILRADDIIDAQELYVEFVDRGKGTSLYLFEHLLGDSKDRGMAMVNLKEHYESCGFALGERELPDYLPVVLEFASSLETEHKAVSFIKETEHIIQSVYSQHLAKQSPWAVVIGAVLTICGMELESIPPTKAEVIDIDKEWAEEPVEFSGSNCSDTCSSTCATTTHK